MIEQQAIVTQCDDKTVWLKAERQSTCSGCQVRKGCGTGLLSNHVGKRFSEIRVDKTRDVHIGQQVQLLIPEQTLLQGAILMYIVPLIFLFLFSAVAKTLNFNEFIEIISGLSGLFIGFYLIRLWLKNYKHDVQAKIKEIVEE
ncbi:MAG: SoxR reducing system RseC family protein [Methylophaga sp.]|nr:SoxR reducing system RseC family protein [Methylophaga sp.]